MARIETALISVADRSGLVDFALRLNRLGIEIFASSGTADFLLQRGVDVQGISQVTGKSEYLGGLVKTLHPGIHAGILANRDDASHMEELSKAGWKKIDMVVVNFYPVQKPQGKDLSFIDIGGPAMARAAAKNFSSCVPVPDSCWYEKVAHDLEENGDVDNETRWQLAKQTLRLTAVYDSQILDAVGEEEGDFPISLLISSNKVWDLRYGENPHQPGAFYSLGTGPEIHVLKGDLSYNNILDIDCCLGQLREFAKPAAVVVKHVSPCGVAQSASHLEALEAAYACDPLSAFGGVIGVNFRFDEPCARFLAKKFVECIVAPEYEEPSIAILKKKKRTRIIAYKTNLSETMLIRSAIGGLLVQASDQSLIPGNLDFVCGERPEQKIIEDLVFAWKVAKFVKSNAIVFASGLRTLGIGAGQPSRVDATKIAIRKAKEAGHKLAGSVMASDGFFPFPDCIELAHQVGAYAVIQPGGSIRDGEVIEAAKSLGLTMAFTHMRHFKH